MVTFPTKQHCHYPRPLLISYRAEGRKPNSCGFKLKWCTKNGHPFQNHPPRGRVTLLMSPMLTVTYYYAKLPQTMWKNTYLQVFNVHPNTSLVNCTWSKTTKKIYDERKINITRMWANDQRDIGGALCSTPSVVQ